MNTNEPLVSVCILTWNHEKYIRQCLESIINQKYKNIEIVYLDNCSSDNTYEVAVSFLANQNIPFTANRNDQSKSIPCNANTLLRRANGSFLCIISGDDWMKENCIELKLEKILEDDKIGLVYGTGWWYWGDTGEYELITDKLFKRGMVFDEIVKGNFVFGVGTLLRKSAIESVGGWDENIGIEDWDMWIMLSQNWKLDFITEPTVYYRRHNTNTSSNYELMLKWQKDILKKYKNHKYYSKSLTTVYLFYAVSYINAKKQTEKKSPPVIYKELMKTANGRKALAALIENFLYRMKKRILR